MNSIKKYKLKINKKYRSKDILINLKSNKDILIKNYPLSYYFLFC